MLTTPKCPTCGAPLKPSASGLRCLRCLLRLAIEPDAPPETPVGGKPIFEEAEDRIHNYKLLQQIGEGGCGVVYMAEQQEPVRRRVALKVIKLGMDTKNVIARFEAEQQAMALMDHPNIAKVFDAGATRSGRPFFVMELVDGVKITEFCDQNRLSTEARLNLFVEVCHAIQHAHQKGVIHRDIKPSNIIVSLNAGVAWPKVIDFGIAKATEQRLTDKTLFTAAEQFIGTPAYMSPEQAGLSASGIDTRSDIYSLGVLLYELLTGRTPFDAKFLRQSQVDDIRRLIREQDPVQPSTRLSTLMEKDLTATAHHRQIEAPKLISLVRGDLDWIVMKALEKDRARRYETANGLALDIQRFLHDEPIAARPPSKLYRTKKLVQRNKLTFAALAAVLTTLLLGLGFSTWQFLERSRAMRAAQKAEANEGRLRRLAEAQELAARRKAYAVSMNLVQQALQADNLGRAVELLNQQVPQPGREDLRGWEWRYLWQFCRSDAKATLCKRKSLISSVSFSSDGSLLAVATDNGEISTWDVAGAHMASPAHETTTSYPRAVLAHRGDLLAYPDQAAVVICQGNLSKEVRRLPIGGDLSSIELAFLSETRLLTARHNGTNNISIWDTTSGVAVTSFSAPIYNEGQGVRFVATPDGAIMAFALNDKVVRVVDVAHGMGEWSFQAAEELTTALAFSPDGRILATGGGYTESTVKLWNVETHQFIGQLDGHRSWITYLMFLPDGKLASASADQTVRLWDTQSRRSLGTFRGHQSEVRSLDVSPDGRTLASGAKDGTVLLWDVALLTARPPGWRTVDPQFNPGPILGFEISPDSRSIATVQNGTVTVYDAVTLRPSGTPDLKLTNRVFEVMFSPDSRLLAATDVSGRLAIWDLKALQLVTNFVAHGDLAGFLGSSFLHGGKSVLTYGRDGIAKEWDTATWREMSHWDLKRNSIPFAYIESSTTTGGLLAFKADNDPLIQICTVDDLNKCTQVMCPGRASAIALSPDGKTLVAACENGALLLWDTRTLASLGNLHSVLLGLHSVAFSNDGRRIVAGSNGKEAIKIWDADSGEDLATLEGKGSLFRNARVSADGNLIAARNWNGMLHVWRAPSWEEIKISERSGLAGR
jgi:WD40 repeat protein/serine/threonine protein kinase